MNLPVARSIRAGWGRGAAFAAALVWPLLLTGASAWAEGRHSCPARGIRVRAGQPIQREVDRFPPGTVFCLGAGVHRLQRIAPKDDNVFLGEDGTILNGSVLLDRFWAESGIWHARVSHPAAKAGQTDGGRCLRNRPGCEHLERLLIDDRSLEPVASLAEVRAGFFHFDRETGIVRFADDPQSARVEFAVLPYAIWHNRARNVTVKGLVVEKYATPAQHGAIYGGEHERASGWLIEANEVRLNSGAGVAVGSGGVVRGNRIYLNGQLGVSPNGSVVLVENNEIFENNTHGFDAGWEGGGLKGGRVEHLMLRHNHVRDNYGSGLWCDVECRHMLVEQNLVERNADAGIFYEISYDAVIRNNIVRFNGTGAGGQQGSIWFWGAGIQIAGSERVQVYGNTVDVANGGSGIILIDQGRSPVAPGAGLYRTAGNAVHGNRILYAGQDGVSGGASDVAPGSPNFRIIENGHNRFDRNSYELAPGGSGLNFIWGGAPVDFARFRALGQEEHGALSWGER